ncbi:uncharacterized protein L969DRAFT_92261 [Mixia osmundae IAM 14324]|uniref:Uncharacterized protein n=1 Tax=Mixia osmundae (strain CBS 9802 / IAM 14324 / JCM 22182 / KY 12970) TaxID=764103 RepID=G7DTH4_MIXOS|nr:uncharacterized protein L969DRAFT_92261 [Mixia osmundae IAM 14324]KEI42841.1 hypothetical protein L969DRAFT_92261 [Mixia osmundae IAM 14324]GAA93821.1 hypothetical protein E5Q_00467 [Mixia osmundae IAM 14324]
MSSFVCVTPQMSTLQNDQQIMLEDSRPISVEETRWHASDEAIVPAELHEEHYQLWTPDGMSQSCCTSPSTSAGSSPLHDAGAFFHRELQCRADAFVAALSLWEADNHNDAHRKTALAFTTPEEAPVECPDEAGEIDIMLEPAPGQARRASCHSLVDDQLLARFDLGLALSVCMHC